MIYVSFRTLAAVVVPTMLLANPTAPTDPRLHDAHKRQLRADLELNTQANEEEEDEEEEEEEEGGEEEEEEEGQESEDAIRTDKGKQKKADFNTSEVVDESEPTPTRTSADASKRARGGEKKTKKPTNGKTRVTDNAPSKKAVKKPKEGGKCEGASRKRKKTASEEEGEEDGTTAPDSGKKRRQSAPKKPRTSSIELKVVEYRRKLERVDQSIQALKDRLEVLGAGRAVLAQSLEDSVQRAAAMHPVGVEGILEKEEEASGK